jgi:hypothetical protein
MMIWSMWTSAGVMPFLRDAYLSVITVQDSRSTCAPVTVDSPVCSVERSSVTFLGATTSLVPRTHGAVVER